MNGEVRRLASPVHRMTTAMSHRGPDDEGYLLAWNDPRQPSQAYIGEDSTAGPPFASEAQLRSAYEIGCSVALGHRRLSIIDCTSRGHQPMASADRRFWIVYNGEIYNYKEVARELKHAGVPVDGSSDTEVLLAGYATWGVAVLDRLVGMYAFAVWDDREKTLFAARDRLGIKPFYYTVQDGAFIFASDIKTLIASRLFTPAINKEGLFHGLNMGVAPRPMTAFQDVVGLSAGHWLKVTLDGRIRSERYWRVPTGTQNHTMTEEEAIELLESSLTRAVRRCLVSDVPVGTFLSGGVDSSTVSAFAAQQRPGIKAFTLGFTSAVPEYDEVAQARATAGMHPIDHVVKVVRVEDVLDGMRQMVLDYEEPFHTLSPTYVISKLVAQHGIKVALNGLGGDELFGGYSHYMGERRWRLARRLNPASRLMARLIRRPSKFAELANAATADRAHTVLFGIQSDVERRRLFTPSEVRDFNTPERLHELYVDPEHEFDDWIDALAYMDIVNYIGNHHLYRLDQFTMRFSVEGRFPLLDHELVESAFTIPSHLKVKGGVQKYILRRVAEPVIHPSSLRAKKIGFGLPVGRWMKGLLRPLVEKNLEALAQREIFRPEEIQRRWRLFNAGLLPYQQVWQLVSTELWIQSFFDRPPDPADDQTLPPRTQEFTW